MIHEQTFKDFKECVRQIEKDFQIDTSKEQSKVLFRGENGLFEKTQPSMKRMLDQYKMDFYVVSAFIDFEDIYTEFYADTQGLEETESLGFLQHYGFPTDLLDLTPSLETAYFFAHFGIEKAIDGCIGVFDINSISAFYEIVDLSKDPYALRPRRQKAWALRHSGGIYNFKSQECDSRFKVHWYKFKKSQSDIEIVNNNRALAYPSEKELAHFFSRDFFEFFRTHSLYDRQSPEQRELVEDRLSKIHADLMQ